MRIALAIALIFWPGLLFAMPAAEQQKVDYLIDSVSHSGIAFIRNGEEYTGPDAARHLRDKLDYAGDKVQSAEDFITLIASKSYFSGTPYQVKLKDGTKQPSADWLRAALKKMP